MSVLEELKKKIADIETQSLAMDGCRPTFTVSEIMDLIDSVGLAQNSHNACVDGDSISRQAAIGALHTEIIKRRLMDDVNDGMLDEFDTESILRKLPSVQPEIIHCRECKHWREGDAYSYCQKLFYCGVLDVYDYMRAEDDFCSLAERREG